MGERILEVPQGRFEIDRHPPRPRQPLRAWDAADEFVLTWAAEQVLPEPIVVVNDGFGALSIALDPAAVLTDPTSMRQP